MTIKRILTRMGSMSGAAWYIFRHSAELCLTLLACGLLLTLGEHEQLRIAGAVFDTVEVIWLIAVLGSAIVEDQQSRS